MSLNLQSSMESVCCELVPQSRNFSQSSIAFESRHLKDKKLKQAFIDRSISMLRDPSKRDKFTNLFLKKLTAFNKPKQKQSFNYHHKQTLADIVNTHKQTINHFFEDDEPSQPHPFTKRHPSISSIDNLLILLKHKVSNQIIKLQIKRQSIRQKIPYNKIIIALGIQKIIQKFYEEHEIGLKFDSRYIYLKVGEYLGELVLGLGIQNWYILRRIVKSGIHRLLGFHRSWNRMTDSEKDDEKNQSENEEIFSDTWLRDKLRKNRKYLNKNGFQLQKISQSKSKFDVLKGQVDQTSLKITPKGTIFYNFRQQMPDIQFYPSDDEEMHDPEDIEAYDKLKYFQKQSTTQSPKLTLNPDIINLEQIEPLKFSLQIPRSQIPSSVYLYEDIEQIEEENIFGQQWKLPISKAQKIKLKQKKIQQNKICGDKAMITENILDEIDEQFRKINQEEIKKLAQKYNVQSDNIKNKNKGNIHQKFIKKQEYQRKYEDLTLSDTIQSMKKKLKKIHVINLQQNPRTYTNLKLVAPQKFSKTQQRQILSQLQRVIGDYLSKQQVCPLYNIQKQVYRSLQSMGVSKEKYGQIWKIFKNQFTRK